MKVIAHRGASGYYPEHSLSGYNAAIEMGADVIEPDVVSTKDGVLIARHEPSLSATTNIAEIVEFNNRKREVSIDGTLHEDWFCFDFTWEELKKLSLKNRYDFRPKASGEDRIVSLEELFSLVYKDNKDKKLIVYPELKHPSFHLSIGLALTTKFLALCNKWDLIYANSPLWVQCFEPSCLQQIKKKCDLQLFQLIDGSFLDKNGRVMLEMPNHKPFDFLENEIDFDYNDLLSDKGLEYISDYANGIGIWKNYLLSSNKKGEIINSRIAERITSHGLGLHIFTFRDEEKFRLKCFATKEEEYRAFYQLKPDAIFSDFPDTAIKVKREMGLD